MIQFTDSLTGDVWWGCAECHATQAANSVPENHDKIYQ
jgi:hypothetical protein